MWIVAQPWERNQQSIAWCVNAAGDFMPGPNLPALNPPENYGARMATDSEIR
jgi:hypothetical protein